MVTKNIHFIHKIKKYYTLGKYSNYSSISKIEQWDFFQICETISLLIYLYPNNEFDKFSGNDSSRMF